MIVKRKVRQSDTGIRTFCVYLHVSGALRASLARHFSYRSFVSSLLTPRLWAMLDTAYGRVCWLLEFCSASQQQSIQQPIIIIYSAQSMGLVDNARRTPVYRPHTTHTKLILTHYAFGAHEAHDAHDRRYIVVNCMHLVYTHLSKYSYRDICSCNIQACPITKDSCTKIQMMLLLQCRSC